MDEKTINPGETFRETIVIKGDCPDLPVPANSDGTPVYADGNSGFSFRLGENASAEVLVLVLPGADSSLDFNIELAGPGASFILDGLYLCPDAEKTDIRVEMLHKVPHCSSRQLFKGIISGTARSGFRGRIVVSPDAQVTEAYQENHNLLLSDTAKADTQPQLEIYADDVKCSHGATVGKLDEDEQFYMRSRGIPEKEAKVLQMLSFISSVLETVPAGEYRDSLSEYLGHIVRTRF